MQFITRLILTNSNWKPPTYKLSSFFQLCIVLGMYSFAYLLKHGKTFNGISHDIISQGNFWSAWLKAISYNNVSTFCFGYFLVYIMAMVRKKKSYNLEVMWSIWSELFQIVSLQKFQPNFKMWRNKSIVMDFISIKYLLIHIKY